MSKSDKKKRQSNVLRSENKIKTSEYRKILSEVYGSYIQLPIGVLYQGPNILIDHMCIFCGECVSTKPSTMIQNERSVDAQGKTIYTRTGFGRGCTVCKTNSEHIQELQIFEEELARVHKNKFSLAYLPPRFKIDSGKYKHMFKCRDCDTQHYQTPSTMLNPKFKCSHCESKNSYGMRTRFYRDRLTQMYDGKISILGKYHDSDEMHHECNNYHVWLATASEMLCGRGCKRCKTKIEVKHLTIEHRNQKFNLRSSLELKALGAMSKKVGAYSGIRTSLDFPIPILHGKKPPAFYHAKSGMIADVIRLVDFDKFREKKKFQKSKARANELGMHYGVLLVGKRKVAGLWTSNSFSRQGKILDAENLTDAKTGRDNVIVPVFKMRR